MREYIFTGRLTLDGVTFIVEAADAGEAKEKARLGQYAGYDVSAAGPADWQIMPSTCELNE